MIDTKRIFIALALLLPGSLSQAMEATCLDPGLVAISGLVPGMDSRTINQAGQIISVETGDGVDDGGSYTAYIYHFPNYDITVVRDTIDAIHITSPKLVWAGDIQLGSDRQHVMKQLPVKPVVDENDNSQHVVCSDVGDVYAILRYQDDKVTDIRLVLDRP